jgi:putative ABC transport system substrate-binding protein
MHRTTVGLLVTLALSILFAPLAAAPPAGKVYRIGFLGVGPAPSEAERQASPLLRELHQLGYVEGQNILIERRYAEGKRERLSSLAAELVQLPVALIVAAGNGAAQAAYQATTSIPIVVIRGGDLIGTGLVATLARPGGNVTGVSGFARDLSGKQLELLKEAIPTLSHLAVLWNARDGAMTRSFNELQVSARALGVMVQSLGVGNPNDFDSAFAQLSEARPDALFILADSFTVRHRKRILGFAASRMPTMFTHREFVEDGGLMAYGPSLAEEWRRTASFVDRILTGANPADLPVEQPMQFELLINLKTAQALGLTIPSSVLFQANEVIK